MTPRYRGNLLRFMEARHRIYLARSRGEPQPWTKDPIFQVYKFTNVYRELDRQTIWIDENIRRPFADHQDLWFMLAIARIGCTRELLSALMSTRGAWPDADGRWSFATFTRVLSRYVNVRRADKARAFYAAWQVNHNLYRRLHETWAHRHRVTDGLDAATTLQEAYVLLNGLPSWGGFMRYELVCDLRHTRYLREATDVFTWTQPGPGSQRGLNRVFGVPATCAAWSHEVFITETVALLNWISPRWEHAPRLELRDVEHSLCEFDKYERTRLGESRPKQRYRFDASKPELCPAVYVK